MTTKTLYMVEYKTVWTGMGWAIGRNVFDDLPQAQEYASKKRDPVIYEIECREVKS